MNLLQYSSRTFYTTLACSPSNSFPSIKTPHSLLLLFNEAIIVVERFQASSTPSSSQQWRLSCCDLGQSSWRSSSVPPPLAPLLLLPDSSIPMLRCVMLPLMSGALMSIAALRIGSLAAVALLSSPPSSQVVVFLFLAFRFVLGLCLRLQGL